MQKKLLFVILPVLLILSLVFSTTMEGCSPRAKTPLVIFAAGSLIAPFDALETAFEAKYPDIDVQMQYHGSIQVIRQVSELHQPVDIVATADANLIPMLMYSAINPDSGLPYANWYIRFATNKMGIAYTSQSLYADEVNSDNWYEVLSRDDVRVGLADPRFDASGYRALMVFKLAEEYYGKKSIFGHMFGGQFEMPIRTEAQTDFWEIKVPEILETKPNSRILVRGSSIMLISLLKSGDIDYAFEYESVIKQQGFSLLSLPDELNLGSESFNSVYDGVQVNLDFKRFATVEPVFRGEQILYGITIPTNAPHTQEAAQYLEFLFGPQGQKIMEDNYHVMFDPLEIDQAENVPQEILSLIGPTVSN
jgi:molybdate/tungstate transport system substrate-binding protein